MPGDTAINNAKPEVKQRNPTAGSNAPQSEDR